MQGIYILPSPLIIAIIRICPKPQVLPLFADDTGHEKTIFICLQLNFQLKNVRT